MNSNENRVTLMSDEQMIEKVVAAMPELFSAPYMNAELKRGIALHCPTPFVDITPENLDRSFIYDRQGGAFFEYIGRLEHAHILKMLYEAHTGEVIESHYEASDLYIEKEMGFYRTTAGSGSIIADRNIKLTPQERILFKSVMAEMPNSRYSMYERN